MTRFFQILGSLLLFVLCASAFAASSFELESLKEKHHVTADRTLYHSNEKVYEAFGHVVVSSHGQRLSCDYLWVDDNTKDIKARGNVTFVTKDSTVQAAEIHFNLETGIGAIFYGKVFNDRYTLKGQLIRRVSEDRFLTTEGEYTTCKDCAESWKLSARSVDLTVEGYAFLDSVFVKIKDVPTLYIPYAVVPVKTKRQSGLLFPRMGASSNNGFIFVQPFFLALDKHQDMTIAAGKYSLRGMRYEGEYRYRTVNGINGQVNFFHTGDRGAGNNKPPRHDRIALKSDNEWPFSRHFGMRWRANEVWDRDYIYDFPEDIQGQYLPSLESNVVATAPFSGFFASVEARRYRNLLTSDAVGFDGGTVQAMPTAHVGIKERRLAGPLFGSLYGRYDHFTRGNGPFIDQNGNRIFDPNYDSTLVSAELIREADRLMLSPEISAPFRLGPYLKIIPSAQYNIIHYGFAVPVGQGKDLAPTVTRYLQTKVEASTVLERVYDYNGEDVSKVKHQLSPFITLSYIPRIDEDAGHPFQRQLNKRSEGLFDQFDIVPLTNSTSFLRFPQGKSIYYGINSRVVRKMRSVDEKPRAYPYDLLPPAKPKAYPAPHNRKEELTNYRLELWEKNNPHYEDYQEIWNVNISQAFDFIDAKHHPEDTKRAFSYLLAKSSFNIPNFAHNLEYRFYPRAVPATTLADPDPQPLHNRQSLTTSLTWYLANFTNFRKTRSFVRGISLGFTNSSFPTYARSLGGDVQWSLNDFVNLKGHYSYDLISGQQLDWNTAMQLTHPSECWGLAFRYDWMRNRARSAEVGVELMLNLMGTGFNGFSRDGGQSGAFGGI